MTINKSQQEPRPLYGFPAYHLLVSHGGGGLLKADRDVFAALSIHVCVQRVLVDTGAIWRSPRSLVTGVIFVE